MNFIFVFLICILIVLIESAPANNGKYVHKKYPYVHVPDYRELGIYKHIHIPYDGGYGPYSGFNIPYIHDGLGDFSSYSTTTTPKPTTPRTTTTTTRRPTKPYDDEGKWKVIYHDQEKNQKKYDFSYLTENGIYQEEQANTKKETGTNSKGYYEYIGDDDKVYRVYYSSGDQGFVAIGDHIPTIPPEIKRALEYVATKKTKTNKSSNNSGANN